MNEGDETLSARLQREGALSLEEVLRLVPPICDTLVKLGDAGAPSTATLTSVVLPVGASPRVTPVPFDGSAREQVRQLAALTFELLKGLPPPPSPSSTDFIGLRPEIVRPVHAALVGTGAMDLFSYARQLRSLGSGGTASVERLEAPDTRMSDKAPAVPSPGLVGQTFGAYELVRRLGEGGMGEVYVGRHARLGREVAIKVLREEFAAMPDVVQRFFQEAKVVNDLKHPNTVEILDFVEEPGRVYLVMELLEGRTIAELDREQGPLQVTRIAKLMAMACDALEAAHRLGVVHRDIKPENLFVITENGQEWLKVLDFGVARRLTGGAQTQAGLVLGTPFYMAPEQAAGRGVDARADLYALGVTIYELLSRTPMSSVTTPQRLLRAASGEPIPQPLTALVASMLALDPSQRPGSAKQVESVLLEIAALPQAPPAPTTGQALAQAGLTEKKRSRALLAVIPAGLVAAGLIALLSSKQAEPTPPAPLQVTRPAPPAPLESVLVKQLTQPEPPRQPDARPPKPKLTPPPPVEPKPPDDGLAPFRPRIAEVRRRFNELLRRYGEAQLTTLEKAIVAQALEDAATLRVAELDASLSDAEHALAEAERRLGH
ncbi:MAG: serine/threonine-protein kinase [Myxococcales bacterium]|nr:serine/threonine-protein kinase [Myxococcales bacterium]